MVAKITFPEAASADASTFAAELRKELIRYGIPASELKVKRVDPKNMDLGSVLEVTLHGIQIASQIAGTVRGSIDLGRFIAEYSKRIRSKVKVYSDQAGIDVSTDAASPSNVNRALERIAGRQSVNSEARHFGVIFLGASKFTYKPDLDHLSFARSKERIESVLTKENLLAASVLRKDMFDFIVDQRQITEEMTTFLTDNKHLTDLIIYYCGHGGFLPPDRTYYLTLRETKPDREGSTGLHFRQFRTDLDILLQDKRTYMLLDCCYAGAAVNELMDSRAASSMIGDQIETIFPPSGTALLAAASRNNPAVAPRDRDMTVFSGHLAAVIEAGAGSGDRALSLADIAERVRMRIEKEKLANRVLPELHVPRQSEGDVSRIPLFRNHSVPATGEVEVSEAKGKKPKVKGYAKARAKDAPEVEIGAALKSADAAEVRPQSRSGATGVSVDKMPKATAMDALWRRWVTPKRAAVAAATLLLLLGVSSASLLTWRTGVTASAPGGFVQAGMPDAASEPRPTVSAGATTWVSKSEAPRPAPTVAGAACGAGAVVADANSSLGGELVAVRIQPNPSDAQELHTVSFSPDGKIFATAGNDGIVRIWDASTFQLLKVLKPSRRSPIQTVGFSPSGDLVAASGRDGYVRVWNWKAERLDHEFLARTDASVPVAQHGVAFSPDSSPAYMASVGDEGYINIFDLTRRAPPERQRLSQADNTEPSPRALRAIAYPARSKGNYAVGGYDGRITFMSSTHKPTGGVDAFHGAVLGMAYSPDGLRIAAAGGRDVPKNVPGDGVDGSDTVKIWRIGQDKPTVLAAHPKYALSVAWSPDGTRLLSGGSHHDPNIRMWDVRTGRQIGANFIGHTWDVESVAFLSAPHRIISVSEDMTIRVWDTETHELLLTGMTFGDGIDHVVYTPSGCYSGSPGIERRLSVIGRENGRDVQLNNARKVLFNPGYIAAVMGGP